MLFLFLGNAQATIYFTDLFKITILQAILSLLLSWSVFKFWLFIPVLKLPTESLNFSYFGA